MRNSLVRLVTTGDKDVMLSLHTTRAPSLAEWDEQMRFIATYARKGDLRRLRVLAITDGGGPDADMRGEIKAFYEAQDYAVRTAAITTSVLTRGIVGAMSFFNPLIRAFSPRDFALALVHLELPPSSGARLLREAAEMDREIGPIGCLSLVNQLSTSVTP